MEPLNMRLEDAFPLLPLDILGLHGDFFGVALHAAANHGFHQRCAANAVLFTTLRQDWMWSNMTLVGGLEHEYNY